MKRILFLLVLMQLCLATIAQSSLSVLGVKMGTSMEAAQKYLELKYGKEKVEKDGKYIFVYDITVAHKDFDCATFRFKPSIKNKKIETSLDCVMLDKSFTLQYQVDGAKRYWLKLLGEKYGTFSLEENTKGNTIYLYLDDKDAIAIETKFKSEFEYEFSITYFDRSIQKDEEY